MGGTGWPMAGSLSSGNQSSRVPTRPASHRIARGFFFGCSLPCPFLASRGDFSLAVAFRAPSFPLFPAERVGNPSTPGRHHFGNCQNLLISEVGKACPLRRQVCAHLGLRFNEKSTSMKIYAQRETTVSSEDACMSGSSSSSWSGSPCGCECPFGSRSPLSHTT